jgi:hypothetical protein
MHSGGDTKISMWLRRSRRAGCVGLIEPGVTARPGYRVVQHLRHALRVTHTDRPSGDVRHHLLVANKNVRVIREDGSLIRELTLDPTRDYQPLTEGSALTLESAPET